MWRSMFLAIGVYMVLLGVQCLGVQKFVLKETQTVVEPVGVLGEMKAVTSHREYSPQPWVPYSLMTTGVVVCIYTYTLPRLVKGK
jgi:hypothetical protein